MCGAERSVDGRVGLWSAGLGALLFLRLRPWFWSGGEVLGGIMADVVSRTRRSHCNGKLELERKRP